MHQVVRYRKVPRRWAALTVTGNGSGIPDHVSSTMIEKRLYKALAKWEGLDYLSGERDCIRYMTSVIDELYGKGARAAQGTLPLDTDMHSERGARWAMKTILKLYPEAEPVRGATLEPGDIIAVGVKWVRHVMIVGPQENTLWQASQGSIGKTGWGLIHEAQNFLHAYRFKDRHLWGAPWTYA